MMVMSWWRDNQHLLGAPVQKLIKTRRRPLRQQHKKKNYFFNAALLKILFLITVNHFLVQKKSHLS